MANVRRFFRYDIELPCLINKMQEAQEYIAPQIAYLNESPEAEYAHARIQDVRALMKEASETELKGLQLFDNIYRLLEFANWMMELLIHNKSPKQQENYLYRLKWYRDHNKANLDGRSSQVKLLMEALFAHLDQIIDELIETAENALDDKTFFFTQPPMQAFDDKTFVKNLHQLAENKVFPAMLLCAMIDWTNWLGQLHNLLKITLDRTSHSELWPMQKINLSQGGVAFESAEQHERFSRFVVLMKLDEKLIRVEAKQVSCRPLKGQDKYLVALEFDLVDASKQSEILHFIQRHEVSQAMFVVQKQSELSA